MSERQSVKVQRSDSLGEAIDLFLELMRGWCERVMHEYPQGWESDSHDGGTFMIPWALYARATGDGRPAEYMRLYRDGARKHFEETDQWLDGYWRRQEAHHGTEHFQLFLGTLWELDPDEETVRQFEDAAEHIGNWGEGVPEWYDWEAGLFRSFHLGTEEVGEPAPNVPDHVRFLALSWMAHEMTGRERYAELARHYGRRWAEAILASEALPVCLTESGPAYSLEEDDRGRYRSFAGAAPEEMAQNLPRAENLLASGVPDALLDVWEGTGEEVFRRAAERVVEVASAVVGSPVAWQAHSVLRRYRARTGSRSLDGRIPDGSGMGFREVGRLAIVPEVEEPVATAELGMRSDKPDWLDENGEAAPSPLLWALRAEIDADMALMTRAVDLGRAHFVLGRRAFGDTTHHGCGSRSLSAVARGHGRLNGSGVVTEVLAPALTLAKRL